MPKTPPRPSWEAYQEDLNEEWNVFTATLHDEGLQSAFKLATSTVQLDRSNAQEAFHKHVAALLQRWLSHSMIEETHPEAFKVLVATAPRRPPKLIFVARPMPEDCQRVAEVQLVQRVLREVFNIQATLPLPVATYVVDLLEDEAAGQRFQLSGPAVSSSEGAKKVVHAFLKYLMRRTQEDFPIEHGHRLRLLYLSNEEVGIAFPQRRLPVEQETLDRLPSLWNAAVADLRARLAHN
jgi:hypothetical protein